jgi:hypothetical protein
MKHEFEGGVSYKPHRKQPHYGQDGITSPWEPLSDEMMRGIELAAYICRMYGGGETWAQAILCHGERVRARWWMEFEERARSACADEEES